MNIMLLLQLFEQAFSLRSTANLRTPDGRAAVATGLVPIINQIGTLMGRPPDAPPITAEEMQAALENRESAHRINQE